jgi:hypothetical protein
MYALRNKPNAVRKIPVSSIEDAAVQWNAFRDNAGLGVSQVGNGYIVCSDEGIEIGRVSYNGRIWPPGDR